MLALLLLICLARSSEGAAVRRAPEEFKPYALVGVCAVPSDGRPWSVVWHPANSTPEGQSLAMGIFKHLQSPEVNACLVLMIESDLEAQEAVLVYASDRTPEHAAESDRVVRAVWSKFGVDAAIREVAETGKRGPAVERMLAACGDLRRPGPIIWSEGGNK